MLFQAVVIFLPILNFFKFHVKGERSINEKLTNFFSIQKWFSCLAGGDGGHSEEKLKQTQKYKMVKDLPMC